jgi:hypothetical protein
VELTMTDEILPVNRIRRDGSDWICKCPHCGDIITLCDIGETVRGEQFQHRLVGRPDAGCQGWLEVVVTASTTLELT